MKKQVFRIFATVSLLVMLGVTPVFGQFPEVMMFNIPFDFKVGKTALPAGEYTVKTDSSGASSPLIIRSTDGSASAIVLTNAVQARIRQDKAKLVFNRYGDQYFLAQVWVPGDNIGRELEPSPAERELAKRTSKPQTAAIAGRQR